MALNSNNLRRAPLSIKNCISQWNIQQKLIYYECLLWGLDSKFLWQEVLGFGD